ncbi:hypothetical protein [Amnibacterium kyonggiense]
MELGIQDVRDSPWATITFLARNHWSGYVGTTYYSVYAGVDRHGRDHGPGTSAVGIQSFPIVEKNPIYDFGTGTTPLEVLKVEGDVATLSDGATRTIAFDIATRRFAR